MNPLVTKERDEAGLKGEIDQPGWDVIALG